MSNKFVEHKGFNLVETNKEVLDKWMADDVFHKSIDEREGCPQFVFFEGPPSANGHPGIHFSDFRLTASQAGRHW